MKKFITAVTALFILTGISSCSQSEPAPSPDTSQSTNIETTLNAAEITSEAFSPAYDPGMPEIYLRLDTTDIYSDTDTISVSVIAENELITDNSIYIQKSNNGEWETYRQNYGSYSFFDNISVSKDNPLTINIDVKNFYTEQNSDYNNFELETRKEYRIMKKINNVEYYTYFTVGAHIPKLKQNDVEISLSGADNLKVGDQQDITVNYKYVGNAEYADYGFGCEYTLEKLNDNGKWQNVPFAEKAAFISLGYNISTDYPTNSTTVYLRDDFYAEPLTAGTYRIVKPIEDITLTALFRINDNYNYKPEPPKNEIELSIKEDADINYQVTSLTDCFTLEVKYTGEDDYTDFMYGDDYKIEKFENEKWVEFPFKANSEFTAIGCCLNSQNSLYTKTISINSEPYMYEKPFTAGKYRVVETISGTAVFYKEFEYHEVEKASADNIIMSISDSGNDNPITTDSAKLIIELEYIGDAEKLSDIFGLGFPIQRCDNGEWRTIKIKPGSVDAGTAGLIKGEPHTFYISIDDKDYTEPITAGKYRVAKDIGGFTYYAEFVITEYPEFEITEEEFIGCPKDVSLEIIGENKFYKDSKTKEITLNYQYIGNEEYPERIIYSDFSVHKLDKNGKWQTVDFSSDISFDDYVIKIDKDNLSAVETITLYDSMFKKPLEEGTYRIVKALCDCNDISVEFEIIKNNTP